MYHFIILGLLIFFSSCEKKETLSPVKGTVNSTSTLSETASIYPTTLQRASSFPIGTAVDPVPMQNNLDYQSIVYTEFNSVTAESAMKFDRTEWAPNKFDFTHGDSVVNFAQLKHQRIHGHTLIWHHALPTWVQNFSGDSVAWEGIFKNHIKGMVLHYKGKVTSWDVVNEAIRDDNGTLVNKDEWGAGSGSLWRQHLGADYIARAFQYAHEADPDALLFYNDYGNDNGGWNDTKLNALINLVTNIKNRGIAIDGIGIQMHISIYTDNDNLTAVLKKIAATGLKIHISELDISVNPSNNPDYFPYNSNLVYSDSLKIIQANKYQFIAETYKKVIPSPQQFGITVWEFSDAYSESNFQKLKDWRLLFDDNYQKKPAYDGFLKGLK